MMKKALKNEKEKKTKISKKSKVLITFICIFLSIAILFGIVFAIVLGVKKNKAVVCYEGVTMSEGVAAFFTSYYKAKFISALNSSGTAAFDTEEFWASTYQADVTYGEYFEFYVKEYLADVVAANYLFNKYSSLKASDREIIKNTLNEVLTYKAEGSKDIFNKETEAYGFNYNDFKEAAKMMYKSQKVRSVVFGENGENLGAFPEECDSYFSNYSHVKLLFIRTDDKFLLDADGNRVLDDNGNDALVSLTDAEKAEKQAIISDIRAAIEGFNQGGDIQMSPALFDNYLEKHGNGDAEMNASGYYFYSQAEYTQEFSTVFGKIVETSMSMDLNAYAEVAVDFGVCFIYKYENSAGAYSAYTTNPCFSDFYSDAADYLFAMSVEEVVSGVEFNDEKYADMEILKISANSIFVPRF